MLKDSIHEEETEALEYQENTNKQYPDWWSEEIKLLVENKEYTYKKWLNPYVKEVYALSWENNKNVQKRMVE